MYYVYFLRDNFNNLYIGQTNNLPGREVQQLTKSKKSAKFVQDGGEFKLVYSEQFQTRLEAMRREHQLKGWSRVKKDALINGDLDLLKRL
jgi:predicted GIY-YIG superfamily endonuclease